MSRAAVGVLAIFMMATASVHAAEATKQDADLTERLEAAQERLDEAAREVAELSMALSEDAVPFVRQLHSALGRRAVLGINLGNGSEAADGVKVISVSPGGPAARAGLQAGDVLTRLDDVVLKPDGDRSARAKLLQHLRDVEPGTAVKLEYRRGEKKMNAEVQTETPERFDFLVPAPPPPPGGPNTFFFGPAPGAFGAAEIVPLTKQLGRYFGTEEGLLIVRAPRDERLKLEDGDVLLDIDGRKPTSPSHALRILASYQAGETMKINVLRMKKRATLDVAVPPRSESHESRLLDEAPVTLAVPPRHEGPMQMPMPPPPREVEAPL